MQEPCRGQTAQAEREKPASRLAGNSITPVQSVSPSNNLTTPSTCNLNPPPPEHPSPQAANPIQSQHSSLCPQGPRVHYQPSAVHCSSYCPLPKNPPIASHTRQIAPDRDLTRLSFLCPSPNTSPSHMLLAPILFSISMASCHCPLMIGRL